MIFRVGELCRLQAISVRYLINQSGFQVRLRGSAVDTSATRANTWSPPLIINAPVCSFRGTVFTPDLSPYS